MATIEELKNNFSILERSILDDAKDPTEDIQVALTWIDYIQNPSRTEQEKALFFGDALPKLLKAVLNRKYDSLKINIAVVLTFSESIASLLAKSLSNPTQRSFKEAPLVLKELLDASNQFYKKCTTLLANKQAEIDRKEGKKVDNSVFLDSLETGSYVDFYNATTKKWDPVLIERFSEFRTECEICLPNESKLWIPIDQHMDNIAPFGTKTSFSDSSAVDATVENKSNSVSEDIQSDAVIDISDSSWKSSLSVGSLIDCRDKNNVWFQACVLDIEERQDEIKVDAKYTVTEPITPLPAALLSQIATALKPTVQDADLEDIYDSQSTSSTTVTIQDESTVEKVAVEELSTPVVTTVVKDSNDQLSTAPVSNDSVVTTAVEDRNEELSSAPVSNESMATTAVEESNEAAPVSNESMATTAVEESNEAAPVSNDSVVITVVEESNSHPVIVEQILIKKFFRVAFVGMPEKFDEWIEINDDRLQKLNQFSFGRRGENPIREEVLTVAASNRSDADTLPTSPEDVAVFSPGLFVDKSYVKVVNAFGSAKGFDNILNILSISCGETSNDSEVNNGAESSNAVPFSNILQLIVSVGNAAKVLSPNFLSSFSQRFLILSEKILSKMSLADIRETSIETLEQVFHSIESVAVTTFGRISMAGQLVEPVKLNTAIRHISSPFLNRRLGGLKILTDLVRRAGNAVEFPTGWRITRTAGSTGEVSSSYSVVPILYSFTPSMISAQLAELSVIESLFEGASSHESLMQRAGPVLRAMASSDNLTPSLLDALWNAGVVEKKAEALKVLVELIESMNASLLPNLMQRISTGMKDSSSSSNTPSIIDLSSAVIIRCKSILMTKSDQYTALFETPDDGEKDIPEKRLLAIYNEGTDILFNFIVDVECEESIALQSIQKLEATLNITKPTADDSNQSFVWKIQFSLLVPLIKKAISNISNNQSVCNMLRLIQLLIIGWPQVSKANRTNSATIDSNDAGNEQEAFLINNRSELIKYLESEYGVLDVVTKSIVLLKRDYSRELFSYLSLSRTEDESLSFLDGKTAEDMTDLTDIRRSLFPISNAKIDTTIGSLKVGSSRFPYLDHLSRLFDFIHVYARCSDMVQLSLSTVEKIVQTLVYHSVTVAEHDTLISFVDRLVYKNMASLSSANTTAETATASASNSKESDSSQSLPKRKFVTTNEALRWVFLNVLCDEDSAGLLNSSLFSMKTFCCVEKWFVWLNADLGYINESGSQFTVVQNTESLIGADVFLKIILNCPSDAVALQSVKFLTLLPQHFSQELVSAATNFRTKMLSKCMDELQQMHTNMQQEKSLTLTADSKLPLRLPRIIMFLEGILEESQSLTDYRVVPHGSIGVGPVVAFHISSTSKRLKQYKGEISMRTHQTVGDLMQAVAKQVHLNVSEIRVYRLGKQINTQIFHKTIAQMQMLGSAKENLVVAEWPLASSASSSEQSEEKISEKDSATEEAPPRVVEVPSTASQSPSAVDKSTIPALVLANSKTYFSLLFALLDECSGGVCDKLWALISKLPTPISKLNQFAMLECESVKDLLMDSEEKLNPTHLLYHLQLIEVLMQPSESETDFQLQRAYIGEIDHGVLESWPERFDQKKGFAAVCFAFEWMQTALHKYIHTDDSSSGRGVTSGIFQQATSLVSKLMRGLIVKYTAKVISTDSMEKILTPKSSSSSKSPLPAASSGEKMIGCEPPPKVESAAAVRDVASSAISRSEWGWRIQIQVTDLDISMLHLQKVLVTLISLLRKLGEHVDYITTSAESSVKSKFAVKHTAVLMILEDLLIIWKCCIVCDTDILDYIRKSVGESADGIATLVLIQELILGQFPRGNDYQSNSKLGHLIVEWFAVSLVDLIKYRDWFVKSGVDPDDHFFKVQSQLILSFLELRLPYQVLPAAQNKVQSLKDASFLFQLASSILETMPIEKVVASPPTLLTESINNACETIMGEILSVSKSSHLREGSDWNDIQEGNLKLLHSLASKSDYSWMGKDDAAVQQTTYFFLINCLGILPIKECEKKIICTNDNRRKYVYELLNNYCARNTVKSSALREYIRGVHTQLPPPSSHDFKPERENKSATGYVGLRNMGSTCYMNSLLQIMYMNVDIRNYVINFFPQFLPDNITETDKKNNVFLQLKKMFYHLKWSEKKSYLPSDWAFAFKDEFGINPINVMQQQDAQEFLQLFCDRIDQCHNSLLRREQDTTTQPTSNLLQGFFGGKICNQMFQTIPPADRQPEIREQEESFVCISLEVKGVKNLEASLERFVAGEQINDYLWNESDKSSARENITKRQCISELSNSIIFHLKRFELNFDTFRREKVNDLFPFPLTLDMRPYTKEGLAQGSSSLEDNSFYQYELGAVAVHTGTADSGHYFSYIKEEIVPESEICKSCDATLSECQCQDKGNLRKRRWLEFNDSEVSEFSESCIEAECFGGATKSHEYHPSTQSVLTTEVVNPKSAYMLVYHRVKKSASIPSPVAMNSDELESTPSSVTEVFNEIQHLKAQIEMENSTQLLNVRILSRNHFNFYKELLQRIFEEFRGSIASGDEMKSILYDAFILVFYYLSHTTLLTTYKEFAKLLLDMLDAYRAYYLRQKEIEGVNVQKKLVIAKDSHQVSHEVGPFSSPAENDDEEVILFGSDESKSSAAPVVESSGTVVPTTTHEGTSSLVSTAVDSIAVYQRMMLEFVHNMEKLESILFSGKEDIRAEIVAIILRVFSLTFEQEGKLAFLEQTYFDVSFGLLTGAVVEISAATAIASRDGPMATATAVPVVLGTIDEDEDDDLLLAIKMSQEGLPVTASSTPEETFDDERMPELIPVFPTTSVMSTGDIQLDIESSSVGPAFVSIASPSTGTVETVTDSNLKGISNAEDDAKGNVASLNIFDDSVDLSRPDLYRTLCPRFIIAITTNEKMQYLTENWRRSTSVQLLLCELAKLNSVVAEFLVSRQLISQIVDIILGNQSPLSGVLYEAPKRKRAPTSYVSAHRNKDDTLPIAARNAPDWTNFLSLLSVLVHYCKTQELYVVSKSIMSEWDSQCINTKTLYTTLLRQYRYVAPAVAIITQMSYGSKPFSDMICEVLFEEFSLTTTESMAHIFIVLESFLSISDLWTAHRCYVLFGGVEHNIVSSVAVHGGGGMSNLNVLELISGMKEQVPKVKFVCTFVRSFAALARQVGKVLIDTISKPANRVSVWAPWMLKVVYRYHIQCSTGTGNVMEAIAAASTTTFPFLYVYGEEDCDREISWASRAEKTFADLNALIISAGANPDTLIPDDTFAVGDGNGGLTSNSPTAANFKQETMSSDEALARFYETAESLGHDLDID